MKKKISIIFIIVYMAVCLLPLAFMWTSKDTSDSEKRELSEFPAFIVDGKINSNFSTQFDTWISEHMGFRTLLVNANAAIKANIFGESAESTIVLGKDGWLFYAATIDDYCNVQTLSDRNVQNIATTLKMMQTYCEEKGMDFVFTVAPNKNTLYGDNMPSRYIQLDADGNLEALVKELEKARVNYADLVKAFNAEGRVLYQNRDSHWTYEGGMLAYRTIVGRLKSPKNTFEGLTFTAKNDWNADLVDMIFPGAADDDLQMYPNIEYTFSTKKKVTSDEVLTIDSTSANGSGNLLMFRDSFGNTTWRYFAEAFEKAEFSRVLPYRLNNAEKLGADTVILEIVERNLPNLAVKAPVMEAPKAEGKMLPCTLVKDTASVLAQKEEYGFLHIYGEIDEALIADGYIVYLEVKTVSGAGDGIYTAFPVFEQELLESDIIKDNGFSAYLALEEAQVQSVTVFVVNATGDNYCVSLN